MTQPLQDWIDEYPDRAKKLMDQYGIESVRYQAQRMAPTATGFGFKPSTLPDASSYSVLVRDPRNIRSTAARFDPAQAGSSNLMAGLAGILATGAGARAMTNRREEERP